jgi:AraC-like DNA-binding protein
MLGTFRNWIEIVSRTLAREGIDLGVELADRSVAFERNAPLAGRLDAAATRAVWQVVEERSHDPVFGISMLRAVDYLDFEELGVALVATGTAESALERVVRYHALLTDAVVVHLDVGKRLLELRIDHRATHWRAGEFSAALITRVLRARFDRRHAPTEVQLGFENPGGVDAYRRYFRCPVYTGAPATRLSFDRTVLARSDVIEPIGVAERFERLLSSRIQELSTRQSAAASVRDALRELIGADVPSLKRVASELHVSDRTLQRRLREEGTSFGSQLEETRRELAGAWLAEARLSRTEIAYLLGFSHPSSLSRALRRWFPDGV